MLIRHNTSGWLVHRTNILFFATSSPNSKGPLLEEAEKPVAYISWKPYLQWDAQPIEVLNKCLQVPHLLWHRDALSFLLYLRRTFLVKETLPQAML